MKISCARAQSSCAVIWSLGCGLRFWQLQPLLWGLALCLLEVSNPEKQALRILNASVCTQSMARRRYRPMKAMRMPLLWLRCSRGSAFKRAVRWIMQLSESGQRLHCGLTEVQMPQRNRTRQQQPGQHKTGADCPQSTLGLMTGRAPSRPSPQHHPLQMQSSLPRARQGLPASLGSPSTR